MRLSPLADSKKRNADRKLDHYGKTYEVHCVDNVSHFNGLFRSERYLEGWKAHATAKWLRYSYLCRHGEPGDAAGEPGAE